MRSFIKPTGNLAKRALKARVSMHQVPLVSSIAPSTRGPAAATRTLAQPARPPPVAR